jgi:hypothetical protein
MFFGAGFDSAYVHIGRLAPRHATGQAVGYPPDTLDASHAGGECITPHQNNMGD